MMIEGQSTLESSAASPFRSPVVLIIISIALAAAAIVATMVILENRREVEARYPGCWRLIGEDLQCKADIATRRLLGQSIR